MVHVGTAIAEGDELNRSAWRQLASRQCVSDVVDLESVGPITQDVELTFLDDLAVEINRGRPVYVHAPHLLPRWDEVHQRPLWWLNTCTSTEQEHKR